MKILTRRTLRRSANSLREPRSKIKPKGRLNRLVPTGKGHQRKAPLAQLPEHTPKLKQPPHLRRRACGSTTRKAPNRIAPVVLAKIDSTLENGRNGMDAGTKRSSDTAALNGSRDRVVSHLAVTIGLCI